MPSRTFDANRLNAHQRSSRPKNARIIYQIKATTDINEAHVFTIHIFQRLAAMRPVGPTSGDLQDGHKRVFIFYICMYFCIVV